MSQGYPLSQGIGLSQGFGPEDMTTNGLVNGYSLSQPVPPTEDIYTDPVDSLPEHMTQVISRQMSGNRVRGPKLPVKPHNRLSGNEHHRSHTYTHHTHISHTHPLHVISIAIVNIAGTIQMPYIQ